MTKDPQNTDDILSLFGGSSAGHGDGEELRLAYDEEDEEDEPGLGVDRRTPCTPEATTAGAIPALGNSVRAALAGSGITNEEAAVRAALSVRLPLRILGAKDDPRNPNHGLSVVMQPGHYLSTPPLYGPRADRKCRIMVVGRAPSFSDLRHYQLFSEEARYHWLPALTKAGIAAESIYVTNVVRFTPPKGVKAVKAGWINEFRRLLHEEIEIARPEALLLMGRDAVSTLMGTDVTLSGVRGATDLTYGGVPVVVTVHPYAVSVAPEQLPGMLSDVQLLLTRLSGEERVTVSRQYTEIDTQVRLRELVSACLSESPEYLSADCEWGSKVKSDYLHGQLRTVQVSWKAGTGHTIILRRAGLVDAFEGGPDAAFPELRRLFGEGKFKVTGHSFRSDVKFLAQQNVAMPGWENGFDTMLGYHLLRPDADGFGLEVLATRMTDLGRYDLPVARWLKENKYSKTKLRERGYADIPDHILHPYAAADVDVCIRVVRPIMSALQAVNVAEPYVLHGIHVKTQLDLYYAQTHRATLAIDDIEKRGLFTDYDRLTQLIPVFQEKRKELEDLLIRRIQWPGFNVRAVHQVRELLFGVQARTGRVRPEGAISLNLTPISTTEKPARDWSSVSEKEIQSGLVNPSTGGETLLILAAEHPIASLLRRLRTVDQVIKNFLAPADDEETDEDGDGDGYTAGTWGASDG